MKTIKMMMIAIMSFSFVVNANTAKAQTRAQESQRDAKLYLEQQLATLADLKEQIAVIKKKKKVTKIILAVAATEVVGGLIVAKIASDGVAFVNEVRGDLNIPLVRSENVDILTLGKTVAIGGAAVAIASGGYLVYLNSVQLRSLEAQVDQIQTDINEALAQIVLNN